MTFTELLSMSRISQKFIQYLLLTISYRKGMKAEDNIQFLKYCGYAFGIPVLVTFINLILNNIKSIPDSIKNGIGVETCSIPSHDDIAQWIYVYGPIMLLLTVNISFYGVTAWKIFHVQQETSKVVKSENSRRHTRCNDSNDNHIRYDIRFHSFTSFSNH
jgi:hypothetical protein